MRSIVLTTILFLFVVPVLAQGGVPLHFCDDHSPDEDVDVEELCTEDNSLGICQTALDPDEPACPNGASGGECTESWGVRTCTSAEKASTGFGNGCRQAWVVCSGHGSGQQADCYGNVNNAGWQFSAGQVGIGCVTASGTETFTCKAGF